MSPLNTQELRMNDGNRDGNKKTGAKGLWRPLLLITIIITILVLYYIFDLGEHLASLRGWIDGLGLWGPFAFIVLYIGAVVAALPGSALTVVAGALFGSILGVIIVSVSSTTGAGLAFLVGRYFARDAVANWLSGKEKFRKLDQLTEDHGAVIVALTRLVPIFPFNLLNYGFGLTKVKFWTYLFWSWLCMLPGTVLYVVGADAVTKGLARGEVPWALIGILVAVFAILILLVRHARRSLQSKESATRSERYNKSKVET